jgi:hypothetical protein
MDEGTLCHFPLNVDDGCELLPIDDAMRMRILVLMSCGEQIFLR